MPWIPLLSIVVLASIAVSGQASDIAYERDVRSLLKERCWACHGALKQEASLRLDTAALMFQGGDSGPAIVSGKPGESPLIERISDPDPAIRMPPEGAMLTPEQIEILSKWVKSGAPAPEDEDPEADPAQHWAFQTPVRPALPKLKGAAAAHPVDSFLLATMEQQGLTPCPLADRSILLRRLYLDLIGVPPTPEELHAFLSDESPNAYETVVDRLLNDPRYGQRWARHWLDIWRYSDWYGRRQVPDVWNSAPQIWRWRDWTVRSLNEDVGYDEMVRLMLAADEIAPEDDDAVVATGYLVRNWYALNHNDWMRSNVEHTGKAFLGLTFNCAHCHDHKYDPILHDEYFQMRAWFEPIDLRQDRLPGETDPGPFQEYVYSTVRKVQRAGLVRVYDRQPNAETWFYTGGDERNRKTERGSIPPGVPAIFKMEAPKIEPVSLPAPAYYPGLRSEIQETIRGDLQALLTSAEAELKEAKQGTSEPQPQLLEQIATAEAELDAAIVAAQENMQPGTLEGKQSLLLDATSGRRLLVNNLNELKTYPDNLSLEFRCRITRDAHSNFQLLKDSVQGLTASVIIFEQGRILSYRPGSVSEFVAGQYDWAGGQTQFHVSLRIDSTADECELTIISETDGAALVNGERVALNGWNPVGNPRQGIAFDARTGSQIFIDAIRFYSPASMTTASEPPMPLLVFDFEEPAYPEGQDVVGIQGWEDSKFSTAPATSEVTRIIPNEEVRAARQKLTAAKRMQEGPQTRLTVAETQVHSIQTQLLLLEAKIAADRAQYGAIAREDAAKLARTANHLERQVGVSQAEADLRRHEWALISAESKPEEEKNRQKEIDVATKGIAAARSALDAARKGLEDNTSTETYQPLTPVYSKTSTGRRRALAEWITRPENPLTARVAVNHIWTRHFHSPLVATMYDFGRNGAMPTHPKLLDWLAVEFVESGWSMKHLHRLLVTSEAYRRTCTVDEEASNLTRDPDNRYLWRMNSGRMEAEIVRDSLLACAGKLDCEVGGQELENSEALTTFRRSLYYASHPEGDTGMNSLGMLFDAPNALDCYRRTETVIPQQALALTNSELVHAMSAETVRQWPPPRNESGELRWDTFIDSSFERILSRLPTKTERDLCRDAMHRHQELLTAEKVQNSELRVCEALIRALFNHNDFVTIR